MNKNIIFDIGNVLAAFDWESNMRRHGFDDEKYEAIADAVYRSHDWDEMDRGVLTTQEVIARFTAKLPQYAEDIRTLIGEYRYVIKQYPYTKDMLRSLKAKGLKVYYLSNYGKYGYEETKAELDFIPLMDGGLFSYEVKMTKPNKWIFMELMERYGLDPAQCVFFDDNPRNAEAAGAAGIKGIAFTGYEEAMAALKELGVE